MSFVRHGHRMPLIGACCAVAVLLASAPDLAQARRASQLRARAARVGARMWAALTRTRAVRLRSLPVAPQETSRAAQLDAEIGTLTRAHTKADRASWNARLTRHARVSDDVARALGAPRTAKVKKALAALKKMKRRPVTTQQYLRNELARELDTRRYERRQLAARAIVSALDGALVGGYLRALMRAGNLGEVSGRLDSKAAVTAVQRLLAYNSSVELTLNAGQLLALTAALSVTDRAARERVLRRVGGYSGRELGIITSALATPDRKSKGCCKGRCFSCKFNYPLNRAIKAATTER